MQCKSLSKEFKFRNQWDGIGRVGSVHCMTTYLTLRIGTLPGMPFCSCFESFASYVKPILCNSTLIPFLYFIMLCLPLNLPPSTIILQTPGVPFLLLEYLTDCVHSILACMAVDTRLLGRLASCSWANGEPSWRRGWSDLDWKARLCFMCDSCAQFSSTTSWRLPESSPRPSILTQAPPQVMHTLALPSSTYYMT